MKVTLLSTLGVAACILGDPFSKDGLEGRLQKENILLKKDSISRCLFMYEALCIVMNRVQLVIIQCRSNTFQCD